MLIRERYRVVQELGKGGGFGKIFEVDDRGTPKVLKVLNLEQFCNPEDKQKVLSLFKREADVLKRLNHPGIARVEPEDGYFTWLESAREPFHCLVMEKIDGHNLEEWLEQRGNQPITKEQAIEWLKQLVKILKYLHEQHFFHRDIKPSNIMLKPDGQLVLIDFGTVREVTNTYLSKISEQREVTVLHSEYYTPPEQINGNSVPQSDFYALGCTLVCLLTGKCLKELPKDPQTHKFIWRNHAPTVGEPLANLIDWLIAPLPRERPENTQVILEYLEAVEKGLPIFQKSAVVPRNWQYWFSQPFRHPLKILFLLLIVSIFPLAILLVRTTVIDRPLCRSHLCIGRNPKDSTCDKDAITITTRDKGYAPSFVEVELRYSWRCNSTWVRTTGQLFPRTDYLEDTQGKKYGASQEIQLPSGEMIRYTNMGPGDIEIRACSQPSSGEPKCTSFVNPSLVPPN